MEKAMNLEALEKRAYLMYHGDGLVDLALGLVVLLFGLGMRYDQVMLAPIFGAVAYPVWLAAKKGITERRLGYVEFSDARRAKEKRGLVILFLLGVVFLFLGVMVYLVLTGGVDPGGLARRSGFLLLGVVFAALISSVGLVLGTLRLHLYSLAVVLSVVLAQVLSLPRDIGIIVPGLVIVVSGAWLLGRFLRRYPLDGEAPSE